jgi:hypothetical protein
MQDVLYDLQNNSVLSLHDQQGSTAAVETCWSNRNHSERVNHMF